jgi:hypothetical protein
MSFYLEKPKRKSEEFAGPLDSILIFLGAKPTPFESTASVPLEICVDRLRAMEQRPGWLGYILNRRTIKVDIYRIDNTTCQFRVLKKQGKHLPVLITGNIERLGDSSTLITGSAQSQYLLWQIVLPFAAFLLFFLLFGLIREIPFPISVFFGGWLTFIWGVTVVSSAFDRRAFMDFVEDGLTHPETLGVRKKKIY